MAEKIEETQKTEENETEVEVVATLEEENGTPEKVEENEANSTEATSEAEEDLSEDDVIVTIGEDSPPEEEKTEAPEWVKELRKQSREDKKRIRELEGQVNTKVTENKPVTLGVKPTLEDDDIDYDTEKFEQKLTSWYEQKRAYDDSQNLAKSKIEELNKNWQVKLENYGTAKNELKVKDFDDAESVVLDILSDSQQGMLLQASDAPALLVYALGKNPAKAKEMASIQDPIKFAFMAGKLEKDLKVTNRKKAPQPEGKVSGSAAISGSVDSTLDGLRKEAEKTGDHSNVIAYKAKMRKQG